MVKPCSVRIEGRRLLGFAAGAAVIVSLWIAAHARAQDATVAESRAGLVVQYGDGTVQEFCIALDAPDTSGTDLLERSGLPLRVEVSTMGTTVCRIADEGCADTAPCWCACETVGGPCTYWSYQVLENGEWTYADVGPSDRLVVPGDVDGWAWGPGTVDAGPEMPLRTFDDICAEATPASTPQGAGTTSSSFDTMGLLVAGIVVVALVASFWWARRE